GGARRLCGRPLRGGRERRRERHDRQARGRDVRHLLQVWRVSHANHGHVMTALVVHGIGALCTCDPLAGDAPGVVRDAALIARDGIITYAGPEATLDRSDVPRGALEIHARGAAVVPGFVDAHTHIVWLGDRGDEYAQRA